MNEKLIPKQGHPGDQKQQQNVLNLDIVGYKYS